MKTLEVRLDLLRKASHAPLVLGRLAAAREGIYFEFSPEALARGVNPSPLKLKLVSGAQRGPLAPFGGLHGLFNDSLPDGFGALLLDRWIQRQGLDPRAVSALDRLAIIGSRAMGAISYHPDEGPEPHEGQWNLAAAEIEIQRVAEGKASSILADLMLAGGSPQGARPKLMLALSDDGKTAISGRTDVPDGFKHVLVKFPMDSGSDAECRLEEAYARMAGAAGIRMPATRLIAIAKGRVVFSAERFDRVRNSRVHMHSACGLLEADHRASSLDYEALLRLARMLTRSQEEVEAMFRLAAFNVLAHNQDDHSKNFAFLQDAEGVWSLAPGYDLTYSTGPGGEHTTTVLGRGRDISTGDLRNLAIAASIPEARAREIIDRTQSAVADFPRYAREVDVPKRDAAEIAKIIAPTGQPSPSFVTQKSS